MIILKCIAMHAIHFPKSKGKALHRNRKVWQRAVYMFFLVLIQERTKENQGWKAWPDGCPVGGTATRYYSPRLWRDSYGITYLAHRHVPPPTHCRVRLLCHCVWLSVLVKELHKRRVEGTKRCSAWQRFHKQRTTNNEQLTRITSFVILSVAKDL